MSAVWVTILIAGAGTFAMRASFLVAARRLARVPPALERVLRQIPPAALAALTVPALVRPDGHFDLFQARLVAGILAGLVAWRTRNAGLTLVVGMGALLLIEAL